MGEQQGNGTKHDGGKAEMALLDSEWVLGVSDVLTFGAKKYASHNWRGGIAVSRLMSAALRHVFAFLRGENVDPESGLSHLYHASCCLMFASWMVKHRPELDDRYKNEVEKPLPNSMPTMRINRSYAP